MPALLTYNDYCQMPDDGNQYEVIGGDLCMSPSPIVRHQQVSSNLYFLLSKWTRAEKAGQVLYAPIDVILSEHDIVHPDLLYINNARSHIIGEKNIQGAPDLVIEILSEGNRRHDEVLKRDLYESNGVQEYWIVDPVLDTIKVYRLEAGEYIRVVEWSLEKGDVTSSPLLLGFECKLGDVFGTNHRSRKHLCGPLRDKV